VSRGLAQALAEMGMERPKADMIWAAITEYRMLAEKEAEV
jgi:hypothetical protein